MHTLCSPTHTIFHVTFPRDPRLDCKSTVLPLVRVSNSKSLSDPRVNCRQSFIHMSFHTSTNSPNSLLAPSRRSVASLPLPSPTSPTKICQCEQPVRGPHQSVSGAESRGGRKGCQKCWGRVASRKHAPLSPVAQRTLRDSSEDEDNDDETTVGSSLEEECSERSLPLKKRARTETVAPVAVATTDTSSPSSPRSQRELLSESLLLTTTTTTSETVPIYNPTATDQTAALISKAIKSINSTEKPVSVQHGMTVLEALEHSLRGLSKEDAAEARWQFHYMELTEYRKKNGHCLVPRPHSTLGAWVNTQRVLYAKRQRGEPSSLTPLRIRQLEALDFVWDDYGKRWNDLYQELVAYKKKTGSCMVPRSFPENPKLGRWVYTQRTRYTQYALSPDRVAKLDDLGFVWKIFARSNWHDCYQQLVDFKQAYGHCRVPRQYDENRKLGSWVQTQRTEMKYRKMGRPSRMTEDRIELLNDLRFEWKVNQTKELGSFTASG